MNRWNSLSLYFVLRRADPNPDISCAGGGKAKQLSCFHPHLDKVLRDLLL